MTIEEKYLELRQKSVNPKIGYLFTYLKTDQNLACIALFKSKK